MTKLFAVALGGALGSMGRYLTALLVERWSRSNFPYETLTANLLGCLFIGLLWGYFERFPLSNEFRLFIFTGVLGGFTTFSTFSRESVQLIRSGETAMAVCYIVLSNGLGIALAAAGFLIANQALRPL